MISGIGQFGFDVFSDGTLSVVLCALSRLVVILLNDSYSDNSEYFTEKQIDYGAIIFGGKRFNY